MGLPDIIIEFSKKAVTAIQNGSTGIVGIMLKDAKNKGAMVLRSVDEIPTGDSAFSAENTAYIERAFIGSPSKVIIYTMDTTAESYDEATKYFATQKVNYIVGAPDLTTEEATKLATWVKGVRKNSVRRPVAVLPKTAGDSRGVINFEVVNSSATDKIEVGEKQYTEAEYCSRIAGLLAGLDLRVSATYKPLTEVTAIPLVDSDEEVDTAIDAGKLTLYTSFSASLLSACAGDTNKSAEIANKAMIDMADNANKMGTDMGSIQNAYQGFAKQNYTMLDNLKLGYGGTKEEMDRLLKDAQAITGTKYDINNLADVYTAIGVIQDKLNITGTTAREAEQTFSGSFAMMKASVTNLLGNLSIGDGEAVARSMGELVESASTFFFGNFIPMLQTIFSNLPTAIGTAVEKVAPQIKENVLPLLTSIKDAIFTGLGNIGIDTGALQAIFDQLFNVKVDGGGIASMFSGLKDGIVQAINTILPIIPPIISAVQQIAPVVGQVISTIMSGVSQIIPYIVPVIQTITNIIVTAMPVIQQIITVVVGAIVAIMPTLSSIFTFVGNVIQQVLTVIGNHMGLFQTIVSVVVTVVSTVWQTLAPIISAVVDVILTVVDGLLTGIETVFNFLAPYISQIWGSICGFFDSASSTITTIVETIKSVFQGLFDAVSTIFGGISSAVSTAIGTVTSVISGAIDAISGFVDKIGGAISKAKEFVGGIGGKVKSALGFAYGKDRVPYDNYPAILHQGEKILTRNQADQYDRAMSTRGVQLTDVKPIDRDPDPQDDTGGTGGTGNPQDKDLPKSGGIGSVTIEKLADTVIIEKEADTDKVVSDMVAKFKKLLPNMP